MTKDNYIGTMLITGNGFDLDLGMKTGYKEFFYQMKSIGFWDSHKDNRLLSYIYEKGAKECWFSFEEIIKSYLLNSPESRNIVYYNKFMKVVDKMQNYEDSVLIGISKFKSLGTIIPSVEELIDVCGDYEFVNPKLLSIATNIVSKIKSEFESYIEPIINDCVKAFELLKDELCKFIDNARPIYGEYSAAAKKLCALFGCDGQGADAWDKNLCNRYDELLEKYNLPKYRFVTFNYTNPNLWLMRIIKMFVEKPLKENITTMSEQMYNIHGKLAENIVFGTDEDNRIPQQFWFLRKCHYLEKNTKSIFYQDLCNSKRIVIFGHSVHGIDFEYYERFFKEKKHTCEIYIVGYSDKSLHEIKKALEQKRISLTAKYIVANVYNEDFCRLCDIINKEQSQV